MTDHDERRGTGWYRLLNPVGTRKPPVPGSQPHLGGETRNDPDWFVFLGHPNRLWVRTIDGYPPALGEWLPEPPTREIAETEHRVGQTIKKARRK